MSSIEFGCPVCGELVRTPAGSGGKRGQCPHCQQIFTIPQRSTTTNPVAVGVASDGKIEFACAGCGQLVRVPQSAGGRRGQCPHCSIIVQIPDVTPQTTPSAATTTAEGDVEFPCPQCRQAIRTPASAIGKRGMCPHCEATFVIPAPQAPQRASDPEPRVPLKIPPAKKATEPSKRVKPPSDADSIQFACPQCGRRIRVPKQLAGKKGRCPDCNAQVAIPGPAKSDSARKTKNDELKPVASSPSRPTSELGLTPLDETAGLTPLDPAAGLTPIDDSVGLTPVDLSAGLTPLSPTPGLTPIPDSSGLTPIGNVPSGVSSLQPIGSSGAESITGPVDDGTSLIPLRAAPVAAGYSAVHVPATRPSGAGLHLASIGLLVMGVLQVLSAILMGVLGLGERAVIVWLITALILLLLGCLQILGAFLIRQRRSYPWCLAAAVAAILNPCVGLVVGIPVLITLLQPAVRESFDQET